MTNEKPVVQTKDNKFKTQLKTLAFIAVIWIVIAYFRGYIQLPVSKEDQAQECISSHAETLAKQFTTDKMVSEVMGYSNIEILTSPKDSGYHLLDFNVRLSTKVNDYGRVTDNPVSGYKCFYDNDKYLEWQKNNPSN